MCYSAGLSKKVSKVLICTVCLAKRGCPGNFAADKNSINDMQSPSVLLCKPLKNRKVLGDTLNNPAKKRAFCVRFSFTDSIRGKHIRLEGFGTSGTTLKTKENLMGAENVEAQVFELVECEGIVLIVLVDAELNTY